MKKYSRTTFEAIINGETYRFEAYTTDTRNGFCHSVVSLDYPVTDTKVSYCGRTWESFEYETALRQAIEKFPKSMRDGLTRQLIDKESAKEEERAEKMFSNFKALHDGLTPENKERMKSFPHMETEADARVAMGLMGLLTLMQ